MQVGSKHVVLDSIAGSGVAFDYWVLRAPSLDHLNELWKASAVKRLVVSLNPILCSPAANVSFEKLFEHHKLDLVRRLEHDVILAESDLKEKNEALQLAKANLLETAERVEPEGECSI